MSEHDQLADLRASLPVDQIAARIDEDPAAVSAALDTALPALLRGLDANAQDPGGLASLMSALDQHQDDLATDPIDVDQVDSADGEKIVRHIYGDQTPAVVNQLGGVGGSSSLVSKLLPILAPIVLSYLAKRVGSGGGGGMLMQILAQVLTGASQGAGGTRGSGNAMGDVLGDLLGGLLGGGRKA